MNVVIKRKEETNVSYEQIVDLMHESFQERLNQGLKFTCSFMGVDEYKRKTENGVIFVAIDKDVNGLMGTVTVHIRRDENNVNYGYNEYLAVHPKAKHCGIGCRLESALESECKKNDCEYILCDTAVGATSSVKYHLKNQFKIVGLRSFPSTNYFSYLFRKQITPSKKWDSDLYCKCVYFKSFIVTKLKLKKDGGLTFFYSIYKKIIGRK